MPQNLTKEDLKKVDLVRALIEQDYRYYYTPHQLAAKANTNESKLRRIFKAVHNYSIHDFYTIVKVEKAKELLQETDIPINEIARRVGLEVRTFNRQFKQIMNMSPFAWRVKNVFEKRAMNNVK